MCVCVLPAAKKKRQPGKEGLFVSLSLSLPRSPCDIARKIVCATRALMSCHTGRKEEEEDKKKRMLE